MPLAMILQQNPPDPEAIARMMAIMIPMFGLFFLIFIAILIVPCWFICKKAGLSPWLSLLCIVPTIGLVVLLYVIAFSDWKVVPAATPVATGYPFPPPPQG